MAQSKVTGIVKSLSSLEDDLDSLNVKVADMKKGMTIKAQNEVNKLLEKTRDMAMKEAETIINSAKESAKAESQKIAQNGDKKITELKAKIDANFDEAVKHVVSTVLKV